MSASDVSVRLNLRTSRISFKVLPFAPRDKEAKAVAMPSGEKTIFLCGFFKASFLYRLKAKISVGEGQC